MQSLRGTVRANGRRIPGRFCALRLISEQRRQLQNMADNLAEAAPR